MQSNAGSFDSSVICLDSLQNNFQSFCRLAVGTSLFYHQPTERKCNKQEKARYCQCTAPDGANEDVVIDCSTDLSIYKDKYQLASSGYKEFRFPALEHCEMKKQPTGDLDLPDNKPDTDLYDPKNKTNGTAPTWPTPKGKTKIFVTNYCNNAIRNSQVGKICSKIDSFDFQQHITQCISDIQVRYVIFD